MVLTWCYQAPEETPGSPLRGTRRHIAVVWDTSYSHEKVMVVMVVMVMTLV